MSEQSVMNLYHRREVLFMILQNTCQKLNIAREDFRVARRDYDEVDREIAMMNRTICPPCAAPKRKQKKPRDFTDIEVQRIADRLGITLKRQL